MAMMRSDQARKRFVAMFGAVMLAFGIVVAPQAAPGELCFDRPGVTACVAAEFKDYWERNGGLAVFGYPLEEAKQEQTPEGTFLVQCFERQRLELPPDMAAPYNVLLGRVSAEVLGREGRNWRDFPMEQSAPAGCVAFRET